MFKVRNKKVYNKTVRPRKTQPIIIERIENKSNVLSTIKKLDEVKAVINPIVIAPVDVTPEVIEPEKINVEEVMEVIEETEPMVEEEPKPKKPRKKAPKKEETNEE